MIHKGMRLPLILLVLTIAVIVVAACAAAANKKDAAAPAPSVESGQLATTTPNSVPAEPMTGATETITSEEPESFALLPVMVSHPDADIKLGPSLLYGKELKFLGTENVHLTVEMVDGRAHLSLPRDNTEDALLAIIYDGFWVKVEIPSGYTECEPLKLEPKQFGYDEAGPWLFYYDLIKEKQIYMFYSCR